MERKGRKMLALGAVIMLCAVAIIGAGYAAFNSSVTARTYNENNSATAGYMTITPSGSGDDGKWTSITTTADTASFATYVYNHDNGGEANPRYTTEKAYYLVDTDGNGTDVVVATENSRTAQLLGSKTFAVANETGGNITLLSLNIKAIVGSGGSIGTTDDFIYFLKVTGTGAAVYYDIDTSLTASAGVSKNIAFVINDGATPVNLTVELYIGYVADVGIPNENHGDVKGASAENTTPGIHAANGPGDLKDVTFTFALSLPA